MTTPDLTDPVTLRRELDAVDATLDALGAPVAGVVHAGTPQQSFDGAYTRAERITAVVTAAAGDRTRLAQIGALCDGVGVTLDPARDAGCGVDEQVRRLAAAVTALRAQVTAHRVAADAAAEQTIALLRGTLRDVRADRDAARQDATTLRREVARLSADLESASAQADAAQRALAVAEGAREQMLSALRQRHGDVVGLTRRSA